MREKVLIVGDQFIEANNLRLILGKSGYEVCSIARSVPAALEIVAKEKPDLVLLDIFLQGDQTGIDLAYLLKAKNIAYVYLSANSTKETLDAAKATEPYGFLVKPFREQDVLVTLDIAHYLHEQKRIARQAEVKSASISKPQDASSYKGIIGQSKSLKNVLDQVVIVAPMDTSVLILGESGTGKERIVDAIHENSARKGRPLIKVNCAALPANLIESELFGHEKGSFTGAIERRIGKFEQAESGTIFLDEIGGMPLDLQVKLLRVLQEKEIERLGGRSTIRINVRIIAATNRNLESEVAEGRFRIDLYYRLNVFPLTLPPLRERKDDIPLLADHFVHLYARKAGKTITGLSDKALRTLLNYHWPGNIRELENLLERTVLLTQGNVIGEVALPEHPYRETKSGREKEERIKTMDELERDHILNVLKKCNGRISGVDGAAYLLGIPASTLTSRMKRLGIKKEYFIP